MNIKETVNYLKNKIPANIQKNLTGERVHPDWLSPFSMLLISSGLTDMYPFFPQGILQIWLEHAKRYEFAKKYCHGKTLDIACGTGYGKQILRLSPSDYFGVDINYQALIEAIKINKLTDNTGFLMGDVSHLPLPNQHFATAVSFETLEHISYPPNSFLQEIKRVLKPDGIVIISTPNRNIDNPGKSVHDQPKNIYHKFELTPIEFKELLQQHFSEINLYEQCYVRNSDINRPSSISARVHRLIDLLSGNSAQISTYNEKLNTQPKYIIAICSKPIFTPPG